MITFKVDDIIPCIKEVSTGDIYDTFISRINPYQKPEPLRFDLRGYAKYLKEHNISGKNVDENIVKMFQY